MVHLPRAIGIGVVAFVATVIVNAIAGRIAAVDLGRTHPSDLPASMWIVGIVSAALLSPLAAWWYFLPRSVPANTASGMVLGLVAVATGFALDCAAIVPRAGGLDIMRGYLESPAYWLALVMVFIGCTLVGRCVGAAR